MDSPPIKPHVHINRDPYRDPIKRGEITASLDNGNYQTKLVYLFTVRDQQAFEVLLERAPQIEDITSKPQIEAWLRQQEVEGLIHDFYEYQPTNR